MLEHIISIKNVGRFVNYNKSGDVMFRPLTLVFGGNGQGKTTLCAILRSLQSGDQSYILERKTLGEEAHPAAIIRINGDNAIFGKHGWSGSVPDLAIYDGEFIHQNIYAGEHVDHEHKKSLYRVIVGQVGVELAKKVDALDDKSKEIGSNLRALKQAVELLVPDNFKLDKFLKLENLPDIDQEIELQSAEVSSLLKVSAIKTEPYLSKIELPKFPEDLEAILSSKLEGVANDAEQKLQEHMRNHQLDIRRGGQSWLSEGITATNKEECPFCGQSISELEIIDVYKTIFSQEYYSLRRKISDVKGRFDSSFGEAARIKCDKTKSNIALNKFWSEFVDVEVPLLDYSTVDILIADVYNSVNALIEKKIAAPLDAIALDDRFKHALLPQEDVVRITIDLNNYNQAIRLINQIIGYRKESAEVGNLDQEQKKLELLKAHKLRHTLKNQKACEEYLVAKCDKEAIDAEKAKAKEELDKYSSDIFDKYKKRINDILECFGADFRIGDLTQRYVGGHPSTSYQFKINDDPIDVGDTRTPRGTPSFRSALSAGDRSSLALAFFIAQLEELPNLSQTIVVFDDPFTSQDRSRRMFTQQQICKKVAEAKQVILTSHDQGFLKLIWDNYPKSSEIRTLQIARMGANGSAITEWDIEEETKSNYMHDLADLKKFVAEGTGNARDTVRKRRPLLEGYVRLRFTHLFEDKDWLGDMIEGIRKADPLSPLGALQGKAYDELTIINDYSKKYHHEQNPKANTEHIDQGELLIFVKKTLKFVGSS